MAQERFLGEHEMPDVIEQWRHYLRQLDIVDGCEVLDVGCHVGDAIALLVEEYPSVARVVGVDRNEKKWELARKRFAHSPVVDVVRADAISLPFQDASFDRVYCADTLEWTDDPVLAIEEMRRVLRPGGRALLIHTDFDTQVIASSDLGLTRKIVHSFTDGGRRGTLGRDLTGLCRAAGFSTVESSVYVLVATSFGMNRYPSKIVRMMRDWLVSEGTLDAEPFDRWVEELHERDRAGTFFYSVNRNLCLCSDS